MIQRGDKVKITNKGNLEGVVQGFYAHTMDVRVVTRGGHEWIISPLHLEKVESDIPKK